MKIFALLALLTSMTACGTQEQNSEIMHSKPAKAKVYSFTVDARPVDGNFQNISIKKNEFGSYEATHQVITAGFGFPVQDTTTEVGFNLDCQERRRGRTLLALNCAYDNRPADGELTELKIKRDSEGFYSATVRKATYATLQAPATDVTTELASGLSLDR